jgi:hypothetical protein
VAWALRAPDAVATAPRSGGGGSFVSSASFSSSSFDVLAKERRRGSCWKDAIV